MCDAKIEFNFIQKKKEFYDYLWGNFKVNNNEITHTSIGNPTGSWSIDDENLDLFYVEYAKTFSKYGVPVHLVEKHKEVSPILIDIDLKFKLDSSIRTFHFEFIKNIILLYNEIIKTCYESIDDEYLKCYVLLKDDPVKYEDKYKDGLHIIYPFLVTKPEIQYYIRTVLLNNYKDKLKEIFSSIPVTNSFDDIFDECVISKTNWQLYGSMKPGNVPYKLKYILDVDCNILENSYNEDFDCNLELVRLFSIRNKIECKLIENKNNIEMEKWLKNNSSKTKIKKQAVVPNRRKISDIRYLNKPCDDHDLEYVKDLTLNCFSQARCDNYNDWYNVGICLHNIDYRLIETWDLFSKKSAKYDGNCCSEEVWDALPCNNEFDRYIKDEISIGTIINWAIQDNLEKKNKIYKNHHSDENSGFCKLIYNAVSSNSHHEIALVIKRYFNGYGYANEKRFVCMSTQKKIWCEYSPSKHRWIEDNEDNGGQCIKQNFSNDICKIFMEYDSIIQKKVLDFQDSGDNDGIEMWQKKKAKNLKLQNQLKDTGFKETLLKECTEKFLDADFKNTLDTNLNLINCPNGVYDLDNNVFRDGYPNDYISLTTDTEFIEYTHDSPEVKLISHFIEQVLPLKKTRDYFMKVLASCLSGEVPFEKFFILTGGGSNGKSKLIELIKETIGDYYHQMNVSALCSKRGNSQQADPELTMMRGKRMTIFSEPNKDEIINVGKLKEWTGGDDIQCRALFKSPIRFKPQSKWFLICNDIPAMDTDDDGTWRRITVINFPSKFKPKNELTGRKFEFLRDNNIINKLKKNKSALLWILIQYYKEYAKTIETGLKEPKEVQEATNRERKKNNPMKQFIDDKVLYSEKAGDKLGLVELYNLFRDHQSSCGFTSKTIPKRNEFKDKMNEEYPNIIYRYTNKIIEADKSMTQWKFVTFNSESVKPEDKYEMEDDDDEPVKTKKKKTSENNSTENNIVITHEDNEDNEDFEFINGEEDD